jgi:hypothetical protein
MAGTAPVVPFTLCELPCLQEGGPQLIQPALEVLRELQSQRELPPREADEMAHEWVLLANHYQMDSTTWWDVLPAIEKIEKLGVSFALCRRLREAIWNVEVTGTSVKEWQLQFPAVRCSWRFK